ncbi:hypothetical protein FISHEDRAFT_58719 [Fistulina hepatica ATCC 64428]|uniref:Uncharacterized protein n=1 Tax=Fistulina hepatica ATCC 64428 TaxID=1128425 RepID=A0A0D7ACZ5_9AGAR|nr:hypothetical protein FISHEDRAFT_58719 [Fistulina hepatica ATCC 64428]
MPEQSQYAAATHVPLIKSPSLRIPHMVELPPDIHPLPDSVTAYFAYPFTLEPHVLTFQNARRTTLAAHATRRSAYLAAREEDKARRKRDALRKVAPGFDPEHVLEPTRTGSGGAGAPPSPVIAPQQQQSVMHDLIDQLAAMDARHES